MKSIGVFSFTCCEGCVVVFIEAMNSKYFDWKKKISFKNFRALKKVEKIGKLDIAIVEGAISTNDEALKLREIRSKCNILIAMGSGACNGYPSNQRNSFDAKVKKKIAQELNKMGQLENILPLKDFVKVDIEINGCPIDEKNLIKTIDGLVL
jgi:sulfhydrogenase subunit delta